MTKKEATRELKKLRRDIQVSLKCMTVKTSKKTSATYRIKSLTDAGILTAQFASGLRFFLGNTEDVAGLSFQDILLYRKEARVFLTMLRATRAALAQ